MEKVKINRMRWPHRGILSEIARELGKKPGNVWKAIDRDNPNPVYARLYAEKLERNLSAVNDMRNAIKKSV
jgi:hypothetical protein